MAKPKLIQDILDSKNPETIDIHSLIEATDLTMQAWRCDINHNHAAGSEVFSAYWRSDAIGLQRGLAAFWNSK